MSKAFNHPSDPVCITLLDGQERKFLLSMLGVRRVKERFGVKTIHDALDRDVADCGVPILYEALLDKGGMTEEKFEELLPANLDEIGLAVLNVLGISFPEIAPGRPIPPSPPESPTGTGLNSGPSGSQD